MSEKMTQEGLEKILRDLQWEQDWRAEADKAAAYYDGNQLTGKVLEQMRERGLAPLIRNLVGPTIDLVLGIEAKAKRDFKVSAQDADEFVDMATAMTAKLARAEKSSKADMAISDAYASCVKSGIGWVEVSRESDPFRPPYRVRNVHRREIYWDFRAKELDLSDARFLVRKQWIDEDIAILFFPKKAQVIKNTIAKWPTWDDVSPSISSLDLASSYDAERRSSIESNEWVDSERRRVCIFEVWYRNWKSAPVLKLPSGEVIEYDEGNEAHTQAVALGMAELTRATFPKVRLAFWCGPHFLHDVESPYKHGFFPYVPFFAYREDNTGVPYGLVRRMISPQDEINARLSKMMWILSAKRIIADSDAVDRPWHEVVEEAARPDAVILMNPNRKNKNADALRVESDFALSQQQFQVLQDATRAIQDAAGIYNSMLGKSDYSGQSGAAIDSLVEQGSTTLAEINDNMQYARKQVGTLLLSLVKEDIGTEPHTVEVEHNGVKQAITLNDGSKTNDVAHTQLSVELEDMPDTPTFRMHQLEMLSEVTKSLPPELQVLLADFMVRSTDLPDRHEIANRITQALGLDGGQEGEGGEEGPSPEEQMQQQQMEMQQQAQQLELMKLQAEAEKAQAEAEAVRARSQQQLATDAMKAQMIQQKLMHNEDVHQLGLDEKSTAMVTNAERSSQERSLSHGRAIQEGIHRAQRTSHEDALHKARLRMMNKPKK
jgi:hypothetical protein